MARSKPRLPTDGELEILQVLWDRGPCTVREVFQELHEVKGAGYTTVLKLMQIMAEKGILSRDESVRPQVYKAERTRNQTQRQLVTDVLERAFGGSAGKLAMQALAAKRSSPEELREVRELLDRLEKEAR